MSGGRALAAGDLIGPITPQPPPGMPAWSLSQVSLPQIVLISVICLVVALTLMVALVAIALRLGWAPARMRNWALVATLTIPGTAMVLDGLDYTAPAGEFGRGVEELMAGQIVHGILVMGVLLVPVAWLAATVLHTHILVAAVTGGLGNSVRTTRFLEALTSHQQHAARRMARYPVPLSTGGLHPHVVLGRFGAEQLAVAPRSRTRALLTRSRSLFVVPWIALREHMVLVAGSGSGKTTLLLRLMVSWFVTAWLRHRQWWRLPRVGRPVVAYINCEGGPEALTNAERIMRWFRAFGVDRDRILLFPLEGGLNLWAMPAADMCAVLSAMLSGGAVPVTTTERYFYEVRETLIRLIVTPPEREVGGRLVGGPPRSSREFLSRFDPHVLAVLWGGEFNPDAPWTGVPGADLEIQSTLDGEEPVLNSARSEAGNLFHALGSAFDDGGSVEDYDLIICILDGTVQPTRARAQFGAIGALFEQLANRTHGREALFGVEEFSAIADQRTRADRWVQRMRKARVGTLWIAQNFFGLGADDEQRESLITSGGGGALLGRQEHGVRVAGVFGTRVRFSVIRGRGRARKELDPQPDSAPLVDAGQLARLVKGAFVLARQGQAVSGQVTPLDDHQIEDIRALPGLGRAEDTPADPALAPVIDLAKRRTAN